MDHIEAVVVGAGVIGLAIARSLAMKGREVLILEAENQIGSITSSRNSGVIHAGIYYTAGSLKARSCVAGREALYRYVLERGIAHKMCGKIIVAADEGQKQTLESIKARAKVNGVHNLVMLSSEEVLALEPEVSAVAALLSPSTGIIDVHELMQNYLADIEAHNGLLALNSPVKTIATEPDRFVIEIGDESPLALSCRYLVNAAGLAAQMIAHSITELDPIHIPQQILAKGNYFALSGRQPFQRLIYPVPESGGLGIHATLDLSGRIKFGPDVEWISAIDYTVDEARAEHFYQSIRRYWPGLPDASLQPDYCGIRSKIKPVGEGDSDFIIQDDRVHGIARLINLYGIESPGLTASLAIAEIVAKSL